MVVWETLGFPGWGEGILCLVVVDLNGGLVSRSTCLATVLGVKPGTVVVV